MLLCTLARPSGHAPPPEKRIATPWTPRTILTKPVAYIGRIEFIGRNGHRPHALRSAILPRRLAQPVLHISIAGKKLKKVALTYHTGGISLAKL